MPTPSRLWKYIKIEIETRNFPLSTTKIKDVHARQQNNYIIENKYKKDCIQIGTDLIIAIIDNHIITQSKW